MPGTLHSSESVENFVKAVYALQENDVRVSTNTLSERLGISAPSVTDMAQRLNSYGLIDYEKYRGVALTEAGTRLALEVLRRHRLIELYLVRELNYSLADVHQEAEALEHAVSDEFVEALARKLGDPTVDPHGDPIPTPDGTIAKPILIPLTGLSPHQPATVSRFVTPSNEMLQHILDRGFQIDAQVEVLSRDPFEGPLMMLVDGHDALIGHHVAACILVAPNQTNKATH